MLDGPTLLRHPKNVYPFQPVNNHHVQANIWTGEPIHELLEGDLNANAKYISRPMPDAGQNPGVTIGWGCYFKLCAAGDNFYFIIANQAGIQEADANVRGYAVHVDGGAPAITIERLDGGSTNVVLANGTYVWTPDTDLHCMYLTREVLGANRFWRLYYGTSLNSMMLVIGPTASDVTYTNFAHWGWDDLTHDRIVHGGEWCSS